MHHEVLTINLRIDAHCGFHQIRLVRRKHNKHISILSHVLSSAREQEHCFCFLDLCFL